MKFLNNFVKSTPEYLLGFTGFLKSLFLPMCTDAMVFESAILAFLSFFWKNLQNSG